MQQRSVTLRPRFSLAPSVMGQLLLAVVVAALVLGPLLQEAAPHGERVGHAVDSHTISGSAFHELLPSSAAQPAESAPTSEPHSHCAIHCSLASLLFPLLLLGAPLLAARLLFSPPLAFQSLGTPPLSPPPQHTT